MEVTKLYKINGKFAQVNKLPVYFAANELLSTERAVYLYGQGTLETRQMGVCCVCGRPLTHPVSVILGIGPECGQHWHDWNRIGGYTIENIERLKTVVRDMVIDSWIPKSCIKEILPSQEHVVVPNEHKMLHNKTDKTPAKESTRIAVQEGNVIRVKFPYNIEDISHLKEIPGRRFSAETKSWTIPITQDGINALIQYGFTVSPALLDLVKPKLKVDSIKPINIQGLGGTLYPYQNTGVGFIDNRNGRALIADEMGLGKTVQVLAWLQLHPEQRPAVIVCPSSLKLNWERETKKWVQNPQVEVLSGEKPYRVTGRIIILNYDILPEWVSVLTSMKPKVMVTDECHFYKNSKAQRTKAIKKMAKSIPNFIALSGTPIVNRPVEIFNAINLVAPTLFPVFWKFAERYCGAHHNGYGWDFNGATNTTELHEILSRTIMIRRLKKDVLLDLPEKVFAFVPMELENKDEYNYAERDFVSWVRGKKGMMAALSASRAVQLAQIEGLKQIAVHGKMQQVKNWISDFLETDEKLVVFAHHKFVVEELEKEFKDVCVKFVGGMTNVQKNNAEYEFQNNPKIRLFIGNIEAAGVGITLTASSNVAFTELPWTPGAVSQAADRVHRIGQRDSVTIHYLLAANTIEEKMALLIDRKRKIMDSVLDGKEPEEGNLISELINLYLE